MQKIVLYVVWLVSASSILFAQDVPMIEKAKKQIQLTGYTRSKSTVTVSSEVSGKVFRVNYDVGRPIGDKPFIEVDPTFIDFQIKNIKHSLNKLEVAQEKLKSRISYLEKEFQRIEFLHKGDRATEVKRDAAKEELDQAKFESQSLIYEKETLDTALKEQQERRRRHHIYAPQGWIVVKKMVEPGEIIGPNIPLAVVGDYENLVVPLAVSSEEYAAVKELPPEFDAFIEGERTKAAINWVNPEFDEKTRKLNIELALKGYRGEARGGLQFSLPLNIKIEGFMIPKSAVMNRYDNPKITLKDTGQTINVIVLDESKDYLIIAADDRLAVGMKLENKVTN